MEKVTMVATSYSFKMNLLAAGGVEGRILIYDSIAKMRIASRNKHFSEIIGLFFFDD